MIKSKFKKIIFKTNNSFINLLMKYFICLAWVPIILYNFLSRINEIKILANNTFNINDGIKLFFDFAKFDNIKSKILSIIAIISIIFFLLNSFSDRFRSSYYYNNIDKIKECKEENLTIKNFFINILLYQLYIATFIFLPIIFSSFFSNNSLSIFFFSFSLLFLSLSYIFDIRNIYKLILGKESIFNNLSEKNINSDKAYLIIILNILFSPIESIFNAIKIFNSIANYEINDSIMSDNFRAILEFPAALTESPISFIKLIGEELFNSSEKKINK